MMHAEIEGPGLLEKVLKEKRIGYRIVDATTERIPDADILIMMGGLVSVNDCHPWLRKELDTIERHLEWGGYAFGTCLGAQLIAKAIGGEVTAAGMREVGNYEAELTAAGISDRSFSGIGAKVPVFHWHGETFSRLPQQAVVLATGNGLNQAFRYGNSYGLQFHWEATKWMAQQWIDADPDYLKGVPTTPEKVLEDFRLNCGSYQSNLRVVFGKFLDMALTS
ncbi:TPA: type 1 glutamine amidotransferase [Candidatus Woesearchaeota archaeon]|nr:type 1 glutamine amidotransferase [Candidatus Woesearchaeota archaeon]